MRTLWVSSVLAAVRAGIQLYRHPLFVQGGKEEREGGSGGTPAGPQAPSRLAHGAQGPARTWATCPRGLTSPLRGPWPALGPCGEERCGEPRAHCHWEAPRQDRRHGPEAPAGERGALPGSWALARWCARQSWRGQPGRCPVPADSSTRRPCPRSAGLPCPGCTIRALSDCVKHFPKLALSQIADKWKHSREPGVHRQCGTGWLCLRSGRNVPHFPGEMAGRGCTHRAE